MPPTTTTSNQSKRNRWNPGKEETLEAVIDLRCATPADVARYRHGRDINDHQVRGARATLSLLLNFNRRQFLSKCSYPSGTRGTMYGPSQSGAKYANEKMGFKGIRKFEIKDLEHEHLITLFHLNMREFAAKHGFTLDWQQEAVDFKKAINPDAVAKLTTEKGDYLYCVEPERQTFTESHLKKAKKYLGVFNTDEAVKLFGARKFRVLFIVRTERMRKTLLEKFAEEYPYRMFWITTVDLFQQNFGGKIFKTPKDYKTASYSFHDA